MNSAALGLLIAIAIGVAAVKGTTEHIGPYFDVLSLIIVLGGTMSATIIAYNFRHLIKMFRSITGIFHKHLENPGDVTKQLIGISQAVARGKTVTTKEYSQSGIHPFVLDGLRYIENQFSEDEIFELMDQAILERKEEFLRQIDMVQTIAKYPPAFGMIGTVIGLVALLYDLGGPNNAANIGPNMAVALVTTLYGLVLSNYIFQPIADNLLDRLKKDLQIRRMIVKGVILIKRKEDPILVLESLNTFVLPGKRIRLEDVAKVGSETQSYRNAA